MLCSLSDEVSVPAGGESGRFCVAVACGSRGSEVAHRGMSSWLGIPVTSGSDPHVTRNADMRRTSEAEPDG